MLACLPHPPIRIAMKTKPFLELADVNKTPNFIHVRFNQSLPRKGAAFATSPDLTDHKVYQDEFVNFIKSQAGSPQVLFSLDNQPDTWSNDQPAAHPTPATYAEVVQRNVAYATAVRAAWPAAQITVTPSPSRSSVIDDSITRTGAGLATTRRQLSPSAATFHPCRPAS